MCKEKLWKTLITPGLLHNTVNRLLIKGYFQALAYWFYFLVPEVATLTKPRLCENNTLVKSSQIFEYIWLWGIEVWTALLPFFYLYTCHNKESMLACPSCFTDVLLLSISAPTSCWKALSEGLTSQFVHLSCSFSSTVVLQLKTKNETGENTGHLL